MTLKEQLAETKAKNIQRMNWLNAKQFKTAEEWEEYNMLKHKYPFYPTPASYPTRRNRKMEKIKLSQRKIKPKHNLKWSAGEAQGILEYGKELGRKEKKKEWKKKKAWNKLFQEMLHWKDLAINLQSELEPYRKKELKRIEKIKVRK
jgi:hypothetical protein